MNNNRLFLGFIFIASAVWGTLQAEPVALRDPTQPAIPDVPLETGKKQEEIQYILKGIFISPRGRGALVNKTLVKEGDKLGLDYVEKINKNSILLSRPGQKRTIYLFKLQNLE